MRNNDINVTITENIHKILFIPPVGLYVKYPLKS